MHMNKLGNWSMVGHLSLLWWCHMKSW